jgi:hypothetical protein
MRTPFTSLGARSAASAPKYMTLTNCALSPSPSQLDLRQLDRDVAPQTPVAGLRHEVLDLHDHPGKRRHVRSSRSLSEVGAGSSDESGPASSRASVQRNPYFLSAVFKSARSDRVASTPGRVRSVTTKVVAGGRLAVMARSGKRGGCGRASNAVFGGWCCGCCSGWCLGGGW